MLKLFSHLTNALKDTSKSDVNMAPKFYGDDDEWEGWYKQSRMEDGGPTFKRKTGYQQLIIFKSLVHTILMLRSIRNSKIYNTLMNLLVCQKGKAITYTEQAAEFDGHGTNHQSTTPHPI